MKSLAEALVAAQAEMPAIEPNATNPHFKSQFVTLDHLIAKTKPVLTKNGLALIQMPSLVESTPCLTTTLIHAESGESIADTMPLILGKQDMQGLGAALTYARRYAWAAALGISDEADDDGNRASAGSAAGVSAGTSGPPPAAEVSKASAQADGNSQRGTAGGQPSSGSAPAAPNSGPGTVVWKYGEHKGESISATPRAFLEDYITKESNSAFMRGKISEFLAEQELAEVGATESGFYAPVNPDDDSIPF